MLPRTTASVMLVLLLGFPLVACAPPGEAEETGDGADRPTVADFAGTWQYTVSMAASEGPVHLTIVGTPDSDDWFMQLDHGDPVPLQVSVVGDSLITESAEYEGIFRPGVSITVRTAGALQNGSMTGVVLTRYRTEDGDEAVPGTFEAVRAPQD